MAKTRKKKKSGLFNKIKKHGSTIASKAAEHAPKAHSKIKKHGSAIASKAAEHAPKAHSEIKKHGISKLKSGISAAKKMTSFSSPTENIALLEKLGELREKGILSEKEFQNKKKEILEKL